MKIKLIVVGKLKEKYLKEGISEYQKRLSTMIPVEIIELSDEKIPDRASKKVMEQIKNQEGKRILGRLTPEDQVIILAIQGKLIRSEDLSGLVKNAEIYGTKNLVFIIGGSLGLCDEVI